MRAKVSHHIRAHEVAATRSQQQIRRTDSTPVIDDLTLALASLSITEDFAAAHAVFSTTELLVPILIGLDVKTLLLSQRVSHKWREVISKTKQLQQKLFIEESTLEEAAALGMTERTPYHAGPRPSDHAINPLLLGPRPVERRPDPTRAVMKFNRLTGADGELRPGSWQKMHLSMPPRGDVWMYLVFQEADPSATAAREAGGGALPPMKISKKKYPFLFMMLPMGWIMRTLERDAETEGKEVLWLRSGLKYSWRVI